MDPGMRRRRARSVDVAGMGILVAEPEGEVTTTGEAADGVTDGTVGRETGRPVEVNPFWSEKARRRRSFRPTGPGISQDCPKGRRRRGWGSGRVATCRDGE